MTRIGVHHRQNTQPSLTQRERESLCWLANGKTTEEIGTIMNISKSTVSKNVEEIFLKMNCSKRSQAIAIASNENLFAMQYKKKSRIVYLCE
jgi:DNA-binding CsgD family transcriptional regulator